SLTIRGLHGITLDATLPPSTIETPHRLLPLFFDYAASGAQATAIPVALIYADGTLQPGLSHINGLMHRIAHGPYAGPITQPGSTRARVFSTGKRWLTVAWRTDDISTVELPWSDKHPFSLLDAWGNGLESSPGESNWVYTLPRNFLYITGLGGPVLRTALVNRARTYARLAIEDVRLRPAWTDALWDTLNTIAADPADVSSRVQFFALLRAFPEIEERWHAGHLTRPAATIALTRLAALARTLCQLEAALGASFLEPLQDTLARCEEFQSAYLTGSTTTTQARIRGDWLVAEVRHLMDEADALAQVDRRIEADAVAALAEWRARALEFAAKAGPLSDQLTLPEKVVEDDQKSESAGTGKKK
ncbi:MAG: hypothetical protein L3K26_08560, partial [Candidatus Hydrogenedentes bacterium]|nr:hypothetical protein [Candidatus Hydrogenedentota bacterium]